MRAIILGLVVLIAGCASSGGRGREGEVPTPLQANDEITALLVSSLSDSCGVCVRDKRREAFAIAEAAFAPGTIVRGAPGANLRVVDRAELELRMGDTPSSPAVSFRVHTEDEHLIGIAPEHLTPRDRAFVIHDTPEGDVVDVTLEVVPFAYGDGTTFLFDELDNRLQVQCRVVDQSVGNPD